ncbi:hypothetical protein [Colwellia sp. RSH04]|uniref:hypothetical protein n=1 Tax=Colwellia sp. RSH04 TaxID=2305464 RepID=UPI0015FC9302|nr:hypothetical protein [Colwellia sp. RSH04]
MKGNVHVCSSGMMNKVMSAHGYVQNVRYLAVPWMARSYEPSLLLRRIYCFSWRITLD